LFQPFEKGNYHCVSNFLNEIFFGSTELLGIFPKMTAKRHKGVCKHMIAAALKKIGSVVLKNQLNVNQEKCGLEKEL
jgi:hypothetical protein